MTEQTILNLDPADILVGDNVRYGLKSHKKDALKASILEFGGVHTPIEVEKLDPPQDGKHYQLTVGAYRHAAASELNTSDNAGVTLPAIVRAAGSPVERLKRQVSENQDRENMSPLDTAVAIKKLMAAGVTKNEIRTIFARPGGKKGTEIVPASNAWVNMSLSFLDLPKSIQEKIHLGLVGVAAAYELTKVSPEKRVDVLEKAEAERKRLQDREEGDEEKYLNAEKKLKAEEDKINAAKMLVDVKRDELKIAKEQHDAKVKAGKDAYDAMRKVGLSAEEKAKAEETFKAIEADVKGTEKAIAAKAKELDREEQKISGSTKVAAGIKDRLSAARKNKGKAKPASVTSRAVKEAAKAAGDGNHVPLTLVQIKALFAKMAGSSFSSVKKIGKVLTACADGIPTDNEAINEIAVIVGDKAAPKVKPQAPAAK